MRLLREAELLMQAREYQAAAEKLSKHIQSKDAGRVDYAIYLKGLAYYYAQDDAAAIRECELIDKEYCGLNQPNARLTGAHLHE